MKDKMVLIRRCAASDLEKVEEIAKKSFPKRTYSNFYFQKYYENSPESFFVAQIEKEIIGYAIGETRGETARFISIAVIPVFRRKGIGRELSNFLMEYFLDKGASKAVLKVRIGNESTIAFWQKLDFQTVEIIKNYYRDKEDALLMKKEIKKNS